MNRYLREKTENMLAASDMARFFTPATVDILRAKETLELTCERQKISENMYMQKWGKRISKSFERPEGTQKDVAELDVLRKCACSFPQYEPLSLREDMLAESDVARLFNPPTVDIL